MEALSCSKFIFNDIKVLFYAFSFSRSACIAFQIFRCHKFYFSMQFSGQNMKID